MGSDESQLNKEIIVTGVCVIIISIGISIIFMSMFKRMKVWFWSDIPNPEHSDAIEITGRILLEAGLEPTLKLLLQEQDHDAASLFVFDEKNPKTSLMLHPLNQESEDNDSETSHSERVQGDHNISNIPETSEINQRPEVQAFVMSPTATLSSDYSTTEFFMHSVMQKRPENLPKPKENSMEVNQNSKVGKMRQQGTSVPHDYVKQSQVTNMHLPQAEATFVELISVSSGGQ
ncbi:uncharacterized protein LOC115075527 [Rhinatrema bivittatum]|uniref:uncharacterized protein LOC115075527 n=1 Tax=Rhinatrema bivittatum TaxID=194408 RepID=UPI0011281744|nr:uncharacterized protein LOC115075527 [Rhinatrema bivittatum]